MDMLSALTTSTSYEDLLNYLDLLSASTNSTMLGFALGMYYSKMLSDVLLEMMSE